MCWGHTRTPLVHTCMCAHPQAKRAALTLAAERDAALRQVRELRDALAAAHAESGSAVERSKTDKKTLALLQREKVGQ